jgi:hypothetical protein
LSFSLPWHIIPAFSSGRRNIASASSEEFMKVCRWFGLRWLLVGAVLLVPAGGCNLLQLTPSSKDGAVREPTPGAPAKYSYRLPPYVFLADFEIQRTLPIFNDLASLRDQVYRELRLPPSNTIIHVYLFEDRARYESFMGKAYPDLPRRRAFFVAQPRRFGGTEDLLVYTYWGERIQQDLRHELTHALLHGVLKDVPLWLDEGLAEFFEVPAAADGTNSQHLEQLRRGDPHPNLARLEQLSEVQQMSPADYREAWAWVHLMLRGSDSGRLVLTNYLKELRSNPRPGPLRPRLAAAYLSLNASFDRHIASIAGKNALPVSLPR